MINFQNLFFVHRSLLRASDTVVHGFIGAFSWQLMCLLCPALEFNVIYQVSWLVSGRSFLDGKTTASILNSVLNFGLAFALSCIIDVDHVFRDLIQTIQVSYCEDKSFKVCLLEK